MWVSITHTDWDDPLTRAAVEKYKSYVTLHAQGEVNHRDAARWREDSIAVVRRFRDLGYTVPLEILANGYGQTLDTVLAEGEAVFASDPLQNVIFGVQMYSEVVRDIPGALNRVEAFPHPIWIGSCLFQIGIDNNWGNNASTYQNVWDQTHARNISSLYWMWYGDPNQMSTDGSATSLTALGDYLINQSPAALRTSAPKSAFLLAASVQ
jgi:hypothetical protein